MRLIVVLGVVLVLTTACTSAPEQQPGVAAPVGDPAGASASAAPATGEPSAVVSEPSAVVDKPSPVVSSSPSARASATTTQSRPANGNRVPEIRRTDWANATIYGLAFCGGSDPVRFRGGSNGAHIPCLMLPRGATPAYAEFLTEEPAIAPVTEDALVLVELGNPGAARQQALVQVQLGDDGRTRYAGVAVEGDEPSASGAQMMTFTSYRVDEATNHIVTTVKTLGGATETRRYRQTAMNGGWERV